MRLTTGAVLTLVVALAAGCDDRPAQRAHAGGTQQATVPSTSQDQSAAPAATEVPFYVGRWAAREDLCAEGAWVFTADGVTTAGEVACTFEEARRVADGYDIDATCTAEGPPQPYSLHLAYAQSAQALLVEGGPFTDIGLLACPSMN